MRSLALPSPRRIAAGAGLAVLAAGLTPIAASPANADVTTKISAFPYSQSWSDAGLITVNDDWSGVTGVQGTVRAILGGAMMVLGLWLKARLEERFLREELSPETADAYRRRVPMRIPFTPVAG